MIILKELLFKQKMIFSQFQINADSETISYHLKTLQKQGLISKNHSGDYSLTENGKKYSADIEVETSQISSRAKLSILVTAIDNSRKEPKYLFIRRLKSPLYLQACFIAGKVRYGEPAELTALRELEEESGLVAKKADFICFHRQFVFNSQNEFLKDNAFCMFIVREFEGNITKTLESDPFWASKEEFLNLKEKAYDLNELFNMMTNPPKSKFIEKQFVTQVF